MNFLPLPSSNIPNQLTCFSLVCLSKGFSDFVYILTRNFNFRVSRYFVPSSITLTMTQRQFALPFIMSLPSHLFITNVENTVSPTS